MIYVFYLSVGFWWIYDMDGQLQISCIFRFMRWERPCTAICTLECCWRTCLVPILDIGCTQATGGISYEDSRITSRITWTTFFHIRFGEARLAHQVGASPLEKPSSLSYPVSEKTSNSSCSHHQVLSLDKRATSFVSLVFISIYHHKMKHNLFLVYRSISQQKASEDIVSLGRCLAAHISICILT